MPITQQSPVTDDPDAAKLPLSGHLRELRSRLGKSALALLAGCVVGWVLRDRVLTALTGPACHLHHVHGIGAPTPACPNGLLILQGALTPLSFSFKVAVVVGVVLASPVWSYQLWAFIAPGMYRRERRYGLAFAAAAVPLFAAGAYLAYWIFPQAIDILASFTPAAFGLVLPGDEFLDFFLRMVLVFGLSFQLPVLLVALNFTGILKAATLRRAWRVIVFLIVVFAAVVVPTGDPVTMLVLAVPMTGLFAVAVGICALNDRRRERAAARDFAAGDINPSPIPRPTSLGPDADADITRPVAATNERHPS